MPRLDDRLTRLAEMRPPGGASALLQRIEHEVAERPTRRVLPALHQVRAMVLAAAAMFVFVGGVAVGHWAFGSVGLLDVAFGRGSNQTTSADITALATIVAGLSGGGVLLVGALSLAWRWRRRRQIFRSSVDRGGNMDTIERNTQTQLSSEKTGRTNRWLAIGLVLALAALAGLGAWLLVDNLAQTDYEAVVDDFHTAMNLGDGPGAAALFAEDGVFVDPNGLEYVGRASIRYAVDYIGNIGVQIETRGDTLTYGAYVAFPEHMLMGFEESEGITVVEFEGRLIKRWVVHAQVVSG